MATKWRNILENHSILQPLAKYRERLSSIAECKDWVVFRDGDMFLWDRNTGYILTTNLKYPAGKSDSGSNTKPNASDRVWILSLSIIPVGEVDRLLLSPGGQLLALVSKKELIIVKLPSELDVVEPDERQKTMMCQCVSIAEHLLTTSAVCLVDVAWHPGSADDLHIVLLTADNYIRTYSIEEPSTPIESTCISGSEEQKISQFTVRLRWAQGVSVVSFDFGSPVTVETRPKQDQAAAVTKLWPIYVLFGNGDVFKVFSKLDCHRSQKLMVEGPLMVYPSTENTERNGACAITCLTGEPDVLVIASRDGRIDHCMILDSEKKQFSNESEVEAFKRLTLDVAPSSSLYIYEIVQLELSLTSSITDDSVEEPFICAIRLYKDIMHKNRYLCMHSAGLHAVLLSWFYKVQEFTQTEMDADLPRLLANSPSIVEHLVCTKPLTNSNEAPLLGLACTTFELQRILVVLTMTLEFIVLPLRASSRTTTTAQLLLEHSKAHMLSPMRRILREPFNERIQKLLQRTVTHPIIKTTEKVELSTQECFLLLNQAIQVLRKEHLLKLEVAKSEIQKRLELHQEMKATQEGNIRQLLQTKDVLREQAHLLVEKYKEASENQASLIHRLEMILQKVSAKSPMMSAAEENMYKELKAIKDNLDCLKSSIDQLKIKQDYQKRFSSNDEHEKRRSTTQISKQQQEILYSLLKDQGEEINDLVKKVTRLQADL